MSDIDAMRGLHLGWTRGQVTMSNVSFAFAPGELWFVIGRNASGKSAFLSVLEGSLAITEGQIDRREPVELLDPDQLAEDTLERLRASGRGTAKVQFLELWAVLVDPRPLEARSPGERLRVAFAAALRSPAPLLLLESPTKGLDTDGRDLCVMVLEELVARSQTAIVATTDVELVMQMPQAGVMRMGEDSIDVVRQPLQV